MWHFIGLVLLTGVIPFTSPGDGLSEAELIQKAEAFIHAKNARQQPNTTMEDLDNFIALFADDFVDEHLTFNVTITSKDELRKGMLAKLADTVYFCEITIDQIMVGHNVAFVKNTEHARVKPSHTDRAIEYSSTNIVSLEFNGDGLITHLRRHHGQ